MEAIFKTDLGKVIHGERYLRGMVAVESEDLDGREGGL